MTDHTLDPIQVQLAVFQDPEWDRRCECRQTWRLKLCVGSDDREFSSVSPSLQHAVGEEVTPLFVWTSCPVQIRANK